MWRKSESITNNWKSSCSTFLWFPTTYLSVKVQICGFVQQSIFCSRVCWQLVGWDDVCQWQANIQQTSGCSKRNNGHFCTRDALSIWDELGQTTLVCLVVCVSLFVPYEDGHKTDYPLRRTISISSSWKMDLANGRIILHVPVFRRDELRDT